MIRRSWKFALLPIFGCLLGCNPPEPQAQPLDFSRTRILHINFNYPDIIGEVLPQAGPAIAGSNMVGLLRVYVDGNDVGALPMNQPTTLQIPVGGRQLELRMRRGDVFDLRSTKSSSDMIALPGGTGDVRIECSLSFTTSTMTDCLVQ